MWLNPIVKKDVRVQARSMKICWGVFAYELILALVFFLAMFVIRQDIRYSYDNIYSQLVWLYPALASAQLLILGMVVPVRTAASIAGEKERQTFDIMMTTSMTPFAVIAGKVMTAILQSMFYVAASMPVMALSFVIGGMSWSYLFWFMAVALLLSFFAASIGILCSSLCKRSIGAVLMSYGFYLVFFIGTFLPYLIFYVIDADNIARVTTYGGPVYSDNLLLFLLVNPIVYVVEFFGHAMAGGTLMGEMVSQFSAGPIAFLTDGYRWIAFSSVCIFALSCLFLFLAARRIDPVKKHRVKHADGGKSADKEKDADRGDASLRTHGK